MGPGVSSSIEVTRRSAVRYLFEFRLGKTTRIQIYGAAPLVVRGGAELRGTLAWGLNSPPIRPLPSWMSFPVDSVSRPLSRLACCLASPPAPEPNFFNYYDFFTCFPPRGCNIDKKKIKFRVLDQCQGYSYYKSSGRKMLHLLLIE